MIHADRLKEILKNKNISQKELSNIINIPESTISGWMKRRYIPHEGIEKICDSLNMPVYEFFMSKEDKENFTGVSNEYLELIQEIVQLPQNFRIHLLEVIFKEIKFLKSID